MSRDAAIPDKGGEATWVTAFVFRVRNVPAALYKAMGGFATNGVNMTKLESYQVGGSFTPRSSMRRSRAIRTTCRCSVRWKNSASSPRR